MYEVYLNKMW